MINKAHKNALKILKAKFPKKLKNLVIEESSDESMSNEDEEKSLSKISKSISEKKIINGFGLLFNILVEPTQTSKIFDAKDDKSSKVETFNSSSISSSTDNDVVQNTFTQIQNESKSKQTESKK